MGRLLGLLRGVPWQVWAVTFVVGVVGALVATLRAEINTLRDRNYAMALAIDAVEAESDTARMVPQNMDSTRTFWQRRAVQMELEKDEIDRQLGQESAARIQVAAQFESFRDSLTSVTPVTEDPTSGIRSATFEKRQPPFTIHATVNLPKPPTTATGLFTVDLGPLLFGVRIGCNLESQREFKPATVTLDMPDWIRPTITSVEQDPNVCNPEQPEPARLGVLDRGQIWAGRISVVTLAITKLLGVW